MRLSDADYARLLELRTGLRHFLRWSEQQARAAGVTSAQHQLLLAIRGHKDPRGPTVGEVADYLLLLHHSTVELIDRADGAGLVTRQRDPDDHRQVRLRLTDEGALRLEALSALHLEELDRLALRLPLLSTGLAPLHRAHGFAGSPPERHVRSVTVARIYGYDPPERTGSILVDRLWPRGVARSDAPIEMWLKEVAPSTELRQWYGHVPGRFSEFTERYRRELKGGPGRRAFEHLEALADQHELVLVTATKDAETSGAAVLRDLLIGA